MTQSVSSLSASSFQISLVWLLLLSGTLSLVQTGAMAAGLTEIRERGYLVVAVKDNRMPLGFVDETGNLSGFEIEIARRLAADLLGDSFAVRLVPVANVARLDAVLTEQVDIAIADVTVTASRRRLVDFSHPYYLDGTAFITTQPTVQQLSDLGGRTVALLNRSSSLAHVRYILPSARLVGVDSYVEGQRLLSLGQVDAFAGDASVLAGWMQLDQVAEATADTLPSGMSETGDIIATYRLLPNLISAEPLAVVIPKGRQHAALKAAVNTSIQAWYAEGWLQERVSYWGLPLGLSTASETGAAEP